MCFHEHIVLIYQHNTCSGTWRGGEIQRHEGNCCQEGAASALCRTTTYGRWDVSPLHSREWSFSGQRWEKQMKSWFQISVLNVLVLSRMHLLLSGIIYCMCHVILQLDGCTDRSFSIQKFDARTYQKTSSYFHDLRSSRNMRQICWAFVCIWSLICVCKAWIMKLRKSLIGEACETRHRHYP